MAGVEISVFFASLYCISSQYRKGQKSYIVFGAILLALGAIQFACDVLWSQTMWIDHRNYPGGPLQFYRASAGSWSNAFGFAADAAASFLCDGLLVRPIST